MGGASALVHLPTMTILVRERERERGRGVIILYLPLVWRLVRWLWVTMVGRTSSLWHGRYVGTEGVVLGGVGPMSTPSVLHGG